MHTAGGKSLYLFLLTLLLLWGSTSCKKSCSYKLYVKHVNQTLDDILTERKAQLTNYLNTTQVKAESILNDALMGNFFKAELEYFNLSNRIKIPDDVVRDMHVLTGAIQKHYIKEYQLFYDILFVDKSGEIFYTMRKESDYQRNIFSKEFSAYALAKKLANYPDKAFVDFEFYNYSGEPSAFFIEPYKDDNQLLGWFVLQFAINKIDNLFGDNQKLGQTGEVILVNKAHYMLTNSRFTNKSTILKKKLKSQNIESKFNEKKGHKTVVDYNGNKVLSSFEVFNFFDSDWLIIAKINEAEVLNNYYSKNQDCLQAVLFEQPKNQNGFSEEEAKYELTNQQIQVDMDEFYRIDSASQVLHTDGVSTCTALIIELPGQFAYMAHISPYDKIYGNNKTDLMGQMLKQIQYFDIMAYQKFELKFTVISVHQNTIKNVVNQLVSEGFLLDQIYFLNHNKASMAEVNYNFNSGNILVRWKTPESIGNTVLQANKNVESLGAVLSRQLEKINDNSEV